MKTLFDGRRWMTPLLVLAFLALAAVVRSESLEYDRDRLADGEAWRLLTGQFVHWNAAMAVADLGALLVAGALVERHSRRLLIGALLVSAVAVAASVHFLETELTRYRGSSGLASALGVTASLELFMHPGRSRLLAVAVLGTLACKLTYELLTGAAALPGTTPPGIFIAPWVHLAGASSGAAIWLVSRLRVLCIRPGGVSTLTIRKRQRPTGSSRFSRPSGRRRFQGASQAAAWRDWWRPRGTQIAR